VRGVNTVRRNNYWIGLEQSVQPQA
jgi:hypothetical protein